MLYWTTVPIQMNKGYPAMFFIPRGRRQLFTRYPSRATPDKMWAATQSAENPYRFGDAAPPPLEPPFDVLQQRIGEPIIVLQQPTLPDMTTFPERCVNCVAVQFMAAADTYPRYTHQHLHLLPIYWWPVLQDWYSPQSIETAVFYVNGQRLKTADVCRGCDFALDHIVKACDILKKNCHGFPGLGLRDFSAQLFNDYPFNVPPADEKFKTASSCTLNKPFHPFSIDMLATSLEELASNGTQKKDQNSRANFAKQYHKTVCPGCIFEHKDQKCHKWGLYSCHAPVYPEQLESYAAECEPWMLHALYLSGTAPVKRAPIEAWKSLRTGRYSVAGPTRMARTLDDNHYWERHRYMGIDLRSVENCEQDPQNRYLMIALEQRRKAPRLGKVPYLWVCEDLKEPPVSTFEELEARYGKPELYEKLLALFLVSNKISDYNRRPKVINWMGHNEILMYERQQEQFMVRDLKSFFHRWEFRTSLPVFKEEAQKQLAIILKDWKVTQNIPAAKRFIASIDCHTIPSPSTKEAFLRFLDQEKS